MGEALFGVGVLGVGVLGDMPTVLWDLGDMCRGRVTGLGVPLAVPGFVRSDLLFDRGVLAERPRAAIPGARC